MKAIDFYEANKTTLIKVPRPNHPEDPSGRAGVAPATEARFFAANCPVMPLWDACAFAEKYAAAEEITFVCQARQANTGSADQQECAWPSCGCDPHANKVLAAVEGREAAHTACSSTYGDLVKRAPYLAQQLQSHEWDNKTPSEQRDWLLSTMDNKTLSEQPVSRTPATAEEIGQEIAFEKNLRPRCTNPVQRDGHKVCEHCGCDVYFADGPWFHLSNEKSECAAWIEGAKK